MIDSPCQTRIKRAVGKFGHPSMRMTRMPVRFFEEGQDLALKNSVLHPYRGSCLEGGYGAAAPIQAAEHRLLLMPRADPAPAIISNRLTHPIGVRTLCCFGGLSALFPRTRTAIADAGHSRRCCPE